MIFALVYVPIADIDKALEELYSNLPEELCVVCEWFEVNNIIQIL